MRQIKILLLSIFFLLLRIDISVYDIGHDIPKFIPVVSSIFLLIAIALALYTVLNRIFDKEDTNNEKEA